MAWRYGQAAPKAVIARTPAFHAHLKNVNSARGFRAGQGIRSLPIREVGLKDRVQDSEPCLRLRFVLIFANLETLIDVNNIGGVRLGRVLDRRKLELATVLCGFGTLLFFLVSLSSLAFEKIE